MHLCQGPAKSTDCTADPYIPVDDVVGKVFVLLWPHSRFHILHRPADFAGVPAPTATNNSGTVGQ
jgi:signal peptidase I